MSRLRSVWAGVPAAEKQLKRRFQMMLTEPLGQVSLPPDRAIRGDRVARTREAIIVATLSLAMDGEVAPIVRDIAMLAGVSARTGIQPFADTTELYVAVLTACPAPWGPNRPIPNPPRPSIRPSKPISA